MNTEHELWTVAETAKILRKSAKTIYRWIEDGKLEAVRFGWAWMILAAPLRQRMRSHGDDAVLQQPPIAPVFGHTDL